MEMESVPNYFKGKTILVTGATGFLAKVFVERILRVQPDVKKLYLLLRASNAELASQRFQDQVIGKDLFKVLRDKLGEDFDSFMSEKVVAVAGDVSVENLGIKDETLRKEILEETDIIVSTAATTEFNERFDIALCTNTIGALQVANFANNCRKAKILLHLSTAYVCGEPGGLIAEEPFRRGQTLRESSKLDIESEEKLMKEKLHELHAQNADEETITSTMKNYGTQRANLHGWPNTYVFTKAMGEMLLVNMKHNVPLIITRPTMVLSTLSEPFPGWIEGVRTLDAVIVGYAKGKVRSLVGNPNTIADAIPADMVINSMIVALMAHSNNLISKTLIYHSCSSLRNPLRISKLQEICYCYFRKNPMVNKYGEKVIVPKKITWLNEADFDVYMKIRYLLLLKGLNLVNKVFCLRFSDVYDDNHRKLKTMMKIVELYRPYLLFEGIFDDQMAENLRMAAKEAEIFNFDPNTINWEDYLMNTHIPGLLKYSGK